MAWDVEGTKRKILDAAEVLFAENGYDAVSLRHITDRAGVTLALASYHFRTKERLFEAVVARRADILGELRLARLAALAPAAGPRAILDAFMQPLFEQAAGKDPGWSAYLRLLPRLGEDDRWLDILDTYFDAVVCAFLEALRLCCSTADPDRLARAFLMAINLMLSTASRHHRLDRLTEGRATAEDLTTAYAMLLDFATAGLSAQVTRR